MSRPEPPVRWPALLACAVTLVVAVACGSSAAPPTTTSAPTTSAARAAEADGAAPSRTDAAGVEWLCRPGSVPDPCTGDLATTVVPASGPTTVTHPTPAVDPPVDCFYVYPTVSTQKGPVANLTVDPSETAVARSQASYFSQVCRVYAPVYPQLTLQGILDPASLTAGDVAGAYAGVLAAWRDYLATYNRGRGVVLIGHSQGAALLIQLLQHQIDDDPAVRSHLVSAVLLGGNVTVPVGGTVGGSFTHIPACTADTQTGCVIAYSSFDQPPPADSLFGRPGAGVSRLSGSGTTAGLQVLCTNPAALGGGTAVLDPVFPTRSTTRGLGGLSGTTPPALSTPFVSEPDLYSGTCRSEGGATWLQVDAPVVPGDPRPVVGPTLGPTWGLHLVDVNIALGDLVALVRAEAAAYRG
jgi:hypothetical protein